MSYKVLFVDDEPENLVVFEAACADRFPVLTATTAREGLELMRQNEVAVVLADQRMPHMTGLELLERAQAEFPQTVRMLVTAYSDLTTAVDAINRGQVRRYVRKPWDHDELRSTLSEAIDYYQITCKLSQLERRMVTTERVYSLGVIASGLARELRLPVGSLGAGVGRARGLLRGVLEAISSDSPNAAAQRAALRDADEELAEATVGAQRLLDIVRGVEIPTGTNEHETVDPSEVLRLALRLMQAELKASVSLALDVKPTPLVVGSSAQLGQVVLNLLVNALDAMAKIPKEARILSVSLTHDAPWVVFTVADTGPGVPPHLASRLFDPFSLAGRARGTGLGLAITKTIVEELGGHVGAENRTAGGALFKVMLRTRG